MVDIDKIALDAAREIVGETPTSLTLASTTQYQARIQCIVADALRRHVQCAPTVTDEMVIAASKALMNTFIKKWFLGSYKGPVYLDCVNGEKSWEDEARAALIAALSSTDGKANGR